MKKYTKLIGAMAGAILGFLVTQGVLPVDFQTVEVTASIVTLTTAIGTYFAPKNAE